MIEFLSRIVLVPVGAIAIVVMTYMLTKAATLAYLNARKQFEEEENGNKKS